MARTTGQWWRRLTLLNKFLDDLTKIEYITNRLTGQSVCNIKDKESTFMNEAPPASDKKAATRGKILQAALACFAQKGYHQTSMDDIVTQSELSKGALYWHFKSKQELFAALIEWFMLELGEQIFHVSTEDISAADKIREIVKVTLNNSEQLIPFFKIFLDFRARTFEDTQLRNILSQMIEQYQNQLAEIIEVGIARGEFRPVKARLLALAILGILDTLLLYHAILGNQIDMNSSANTAIEVILAGLKNRND
jgi:AcrR family transcriptional regulator